MRVIYDDDKAMKKEDNKPLTELQKTQISDLADGRLRGDAFADAMALLDKNSHALAAWHGLHVMGDVLRGQTWVNTASNAQGGASDIAFLGTFRANLANEPRLTRVAEPIHGHVVQSNVTSKILSIANESYINWKWVGGLSAVAAAFVFSWNFIGTTVIAPNGSGAQLAQSAVLASPVETHSAAGVMLRNPQLDALIAAHNQVSGSSALQMPSGFLRSATFNATALGDK
jgi:sigma-E factor negative regulatory protein RseA